MQTKRSDILAELEVIAGDSPDGLLRAADVVEYARDQSTALHSCFTWKNSEAAEKWRLFQARNIIRVSVKVLPNQVKPYRAFVSLMGDRQEAAGGYRVTATVLTDEAQRTALLMQAQAELRVLRKKYAELKELAEVFAAIDRM